MKFLFTVLCMCCLQQLFAQELFVYSEPASNMAAKSIGFRVANNLMRRTGTNRYDYQVIPELMTAVSRRIMIHAEAFADNYENSFRLNGGSLYIKYRFYSHDEVHSHFRMAAYSKVAFIKTGKPQEAINLNGQNSGYEAGIVATRLINKLAVSAGSSLVHSADDNSSLTGNYRNALSYNLSFGQLLLPELYTDYRQTNVNLMLEILGQVNAATGKSFLDIAPSVQMIFLSRMRADFGYRFAIQEKLQRQNNNGFLVRFEYNIFNAYK